MNRFHEKMSLLDSERPAKAFETLPLRRTEFPKIFTSSEYLNVLAYMKQIKPIYPVNTIWINKQDKRIDLPMPSLSSAQDTKDWKALKAHLEMCDRTKTPPPCRYLHLKGKCQNNGCTYDHWKLLSECQRTELAKTLKKYACVAGSECRDPDCMYAHLRAYYSYGGRCSHGDSCHLHQFHGIDISPRYPFATGTAMSRPRSQTGTQNGPRPEISM